jgi:hypothetical protein
MAQASEQPSGGVHKETQIEARGQFTADGRRWTQIQNLVGRERFLLIVVRMNSETRIFGEKMV